MAYAVALAHTARPSLRELADADRKTVRDSLQTELRGEPSLTTSRIHVWALPDVGPYWLTVLSCGWQAAYTHLTEQELREWSGRYGRPSPYLGFYVVDLEPIKSTGPLAGGMDRPG